MDILRTPPKKTRRNVMIGAGIGVIVLITLWTLTLDPAAPG